MKNFLDHDFLLENDVSKMLFHEYAKNMPIYDYHNHLNPKEIYEDIKFDSITKLWLGEDHYKWRAMRANGISEDFITGSKSDYEKFLAYAKTVPYTLGNPLYHWTHLELQRYFNINETLNESNAQIIYERCNELLQTNEYSVRSLIKKSNVKVLCTTDDPKDNLMYHKLLKEENFECKVLPSFRPDNLIHVEKNSFIPYLNSLNEMGYNVTTFSDVLMFLKDRIKYFNEVGCRVSDHGLDTVMYHESNIDEVSIIFEKAKFNVELTFLELKKYKGFLLSYLGKEYNKVNWVMQYHIGPLRNNNTRLFNQIGADTGFDSINDGSVALDLSKLLDSMNKTDELPKTVLYCLNPSDNAVLSAMAGNFQDGKTIGKIQFGSAWWFLDSKPGIIKQLEDLSSMGLLSRFIGMLTDSRSFVSFTRHEYFRRILCNEIGKLVENGEYPLDYDILKEIIEGICFNNINNYISK